MGPLVPPASQRHRFYTGSAEAQRPAGEGLSMGDKCSAEHGILRDSVEGVYGIVLQCLSVLWRECVGVCCIESVLECAVEGVCWSV